MTSITSTNATNFSTLIESRYQVMTGIASSSNGAIIYISIYGVSNTGVIKSTDYGATWNIVNSNSNSFTSIVCSSDGTIVYLAALGDGLYKSINSGTSWNKVTFYPNDSLPDILGQNPETNDYHFNGYALSNIYQIACDASGSKLIMTTNATASIYQSIDGGITWSFIYATPGYATAPNTYTSVASNGDGTILYAALNNITTKKIIVSKDSGVTWSNLNTYGIYGPFLTLATNSYGDFVFAVDGNSHLNIFYPTHADKAVLIPSSGNTLVALGIYNNGNNVYISQNSYQSIINGAVVQYSIVNKYLPGQSPTIPCFKEDSKILCYNIQEKKEKYVKIQDIRKGDLVKTVLNGYIPVDVIGTTKIYNSSDIKNPNKLYKCSIQKYPELFEDLYITGYHAILVKKITENQRKKIKELMGDVYVTDKNYRLIACLDDRAESYLKEGEFSIWHFALENDDYYMNYGIYANGLLVESSSKRYMKEHSGMKFIE
jgi:hypothetical protein